ncbi:hypothetical protein BK722_18100 [Bacillus thuringiensis serovar finitimus]|nr:hypothetical protein YBT020_28816 [Bacillus thuringiensis serovar finitimus YBT-020]OTX69085.1 hypothetical protein BK722_18100 [Bacillus thuringiensis serovar finitimus]OTY30192.1 hypothetical protein BK736_26930 [Bacillus thuringiensis serovar poloniensis]
MNDNIAKYDFNTNKESFNKTKKAFSIINKRDIIVFDTHTIHIIKIKVVQVGGRHLRVSFFL